MARTARLTNDKAVKAIKPEPGQRYAIEYKDPDHSGFYLRLSYGGSKQFFFRYKKKDKQYKIGIGQYGKIDCADAFLKWKDYRDQVDRGEHPALKIIPHKKSDPRAITLARLFDDYYKPQYLSKLRDKRTSQMFELHVRDKLGDRVAMSIATGDINDLLEPLEQTHYHTARKLLSLLRKMYTWANSSKRQLIQCPNPCLDFQLDKHTSKEPETIKQAEIKKLWKHLPDTPAGRALKVQFLSGCRGDEVAGMTETELDRDAKTWSIPATRNKGKRLHILPLSPMAWEIIGQPTESDVIFPAHGNVPHLTRNGMYQSLKRTCIAAKIPRYGTHAIRRTVATLLDEIGIRGVVADRILNHTPRTLREQRYTAHKFINEKREALEALEAKLITIINAK